MRKEEYVDFIKKFMPLMWQKCLDKYNKKEEAINLIAEMCYKYQLKGTDLFNHIFNNDLICSAEFPKEEMDFWIQVNDEINSSYRL